MELGGCPRWGLGTKQACAFEPLFIWGRGRAGASHRLEAPQPLPPPQPHNRTAHRGVGNAVLHLAILAGNLWAPCPRWHLLLQADFWDARPAGSLQHLPPLLLLLLLLLLPGGGAAAAARQQQEHYHRCSAGSYKQRQPAYPLAPMRSDIRHHQARAGRAGRGKWPMTVK